MLVITTIQETFTPFETFKCLSEYICAQNNFDKKIASYAQLSLKSKAWARLVITQKIY